MSGNTPGPALGAQAAHPLMPPLDDGRSARGYPYPESGLTKRETAAIAAMQGQIARGYATTPEKVAAKAVAYADALMAELDRLKP